MTNSELNVSQDLDLIARHNGRQQVWTGSSGHCIRCHYICWRNGYNIDAIGSTNLWCVCRLKNSHAIDVVMGWLMARLLGQSFRWNRNLCLCLTSGQSGGQSGGQRRRNASRWIRRARRRQRLCCLNSIGLEWRRCRYHRLADASGHRAIARGTTRSALYCITLRLTRKGSYNYKKVSAKHLYQKTDINSNPHKKQ